LGAPGRYHGHGDIGFHSLAFSTARKPLGRDEGPARTPALAFSGGQQQRLCIARALASSPDILLLDEPASALDPIATAKLEETLAELSREIAVLLVTHNMQQAARVAQPPRSIPRRSRRGGGDHAVVLGTA